MEQWFITEWREERSENKAFRAAMLDRVGDLDSRVVALETRHAVTAEGGVRLTTWIGVVVGVAGLVISAIVML